jgi:hypothetical protein
MAQVPSESWTQYSLMVNFESALEAGTLIHIKDESGEEVLTFAPTKQFQSIVLCSSQVQEGSTYKVYVGGDSTGIAADGIYSGGVYTPGSEYATLTVSGAVTVYGQTGMGPGSGQRPGGGAPLGR